MANQQYNHGNRPASLFISALKVIVDHYLGPCLRLPSADHTWAAEIAEEVIDCIYVEPGRRMVKALKLLCTSPEGMFRRILESLREATLINAATLPLLFYLGFLENIRLRKYPLLPAHISTLLRCVPESPISNLCILDIGYTRADDSVLRALSQSATAHSIRVLNCERVYALTDHGMQWLARCTALTTLNLSKCTGITLAGLQTLADVCQTLTKLNISHNWNVDFRVVAFLCGLPISNTQPAVIPRIPFPELTSLDIRNGHIDSAGLSTLVALRPNIARFAHLKMVQRGVNGGEMTGLILAAIPNLKTIPFGDTLEPEHVMQYVQTLTGLQRLKVHHVSSQLLGVVCDRQRTLECLHISLNENEPIHEADVRIDQLTRLRHLKLQHIALASGGLSILQRLSTLSTLDKLSFIECDLTARDVSTAEDPLRIALSQLSQLSFLEFSRCTLMSLKGALRACQRLLRLRIIHCTSEAAPALRITHTRLVQLVCKHTVAEIDIECPNLQKLSVGWHSRSNIIPHIAFMQPPRAMRNLALMHVDLAMNQPEYAVRLRALPNLEQIAIGQYATAPPVHILSQFVKLTRLSLISHATLTSAMLAAILAGCSVLQRLELNDCSGVCDLNGCMSSSLYSLGLYDLQALSGEIALEQFPNIVHVTLSNVGVSAVTAVHCTFLRDTTIGWCNRLTEVRVVGGGAFGHLIVRCIPELTRLVLDAPQIACLAVVMADKLESLEGVNCPALWGLHVEEIPIGIAELEGIVRRCMKMKILTVRVDIHPTELEAMLVRAQRQDILLKARARTINVGR